LGTENPVAVQIGQFPFAATPSRFAEIVNRIEAARAPAPAPAAPVRLSGHVLLADDDEDLRSLLEMHLTALGLEVTAVVDGHEAVEAILARSFACIIMDMQMPVLDGYSAASAMRAGGYAGGILGLTANDAPELLERARAAGCNRVLTKPVSRTQLRDALLPLLSLAPAPTLPQKEIMTHA